MILLKDGLTNIEKWYKLLLSAVWLIKFFVSDFFTGNRHGSVGDCRYMEAWRNWLTCWVREAKLPEVYSWFTRNVTNGCWFESRRSQTG